MLFDWGSFLLTPSFTAEESSSRYIVGAIACFEYPTEKKLSNKIQATTVAVYCARLIGISRVTPYRFGTRKWMHPPNSP